MANSDLSNNIKTAIALNSATIGSTTTTVGTAIDTQGYDSVALLPFLGTRTDGTFTFTVTECATSGGTYTAVDSANFTGNVVLNTSNTTGKIGVRNTLRYVKISCASTSVTSGSNVGALAVLSHARSAPVA